MKKILSTMLVGALIAGIAFAEMSFDYKGTAILGNKTNTMTNIYRKDCLNLGFKNDIAGIVLDFDLTDGDNADAPAATKLELDQFYGYLTFGLPVGNLQITSGKWDARWVNRIKGDGGELDGVFYEAFKPGVMNGMVAGDVDNLTGNGNMSTVLAYTLNDVLPGSLMFKFGLVGLQGSPFKMDKTDNPFSAQTSKLKDVTTTTLYNEGKADGTDLNAGFVGQIALRLDDLFKLNVDFKTLKQNAYAFGVFLSPLMVEKLSATVGFSMGIYNQGDKIAEAKRFDYTEWGVDLRLRYAITEKVAVTTMHNISGYKLSPKAADSSDSMAMWNMISASVKAGDNIRFLATVQNKNTNWKASSPEANTFAITPACEIKINDKAKVTTAFDLRWTGVAPYGGTGSMHLPIYVNFSL